MIRPVAVSVALARFLRLVLRPILVVVRLDSLPGCAVLARVGGGGHADMREDARDRADGLGAALAEHHAHVALQVLRVLDEAEPHGRLVAGAQVLLRHRRDRRGLTHAADVN